MKVISITGGVGSGKSEVLKILKEEFGAQIILADQVAH
ncbi:MAG: dephospho-CoA kinase, partial [Otoolea sp.]